MPRAIGAARRRRLRSRSSTTPGTGRRAGTAPGSTGLRDTTSPRMRLDQRTTRLAGPTPRRIPRSSARRCARSLRRVSTPSSSRGGDRGRPRTGAFARSPRRPAVQGSRWRSTWSRGTDGPRVGSWTRSAACGTSASATPTSTTRRGIRTRHGEQHCRGSAAGCVSSPTRPWPERRRKAASRGSTRTTCSCTTAGRSGGCARPPAG